MNPSCRSREEPFTVKAQSTSHSYTWTIDHFEVSLEDISSCQTEFEIPNVSGKWALEFRSPNETDFGSLILKLVQLTSPTSVYLQFHAHILSAHETRECDTRLKWPDTKFYLFGITSSTTLHPQCRQFQSQSHGYQQFVSLEDLTDQTLIRNGALTIVYDIQVLHGIGLEVVDTIANQNPVTSINCQLFPKLLKQHEPRVVDDLKAVYKDGHGTDTTILAGGREFLVHSVILMARSNVFRAMFDHDMKEKTNRRIDIGDLSADVVDAMLHFMYTDEAPNMDALAVELLAAADKYDIPRLKAECQRHITAALDVDNAASMLTLADMHKAGELQSASVRFITRNLRAVMQSEGWNSLSHESTQKLFDELADMQHNKT